jgi:peptide/nickel transport system substrate-binding protein
VVAPTTSTTAAATQPAATTKPAVTTTQPSAPATSVAPTSAPAPAKVVPTGTIRIADLTFSYESMDPIFYESFWGWSMYDPLVTWDDKGNVVGAIAESWTLSPDGKTWTFKIRKGIKFHNGDPLTAADVAFSVQRFASPDSTNPWSPYLRANFDSLSTPDDFTFVYKSKNPEPALVIPFAATRILPKNYFTKVGLDGFRAAPVGSGPWKFGKFVSKTSMEMDANTEHWRIVPAFAKVIELLVPEEASRIALLKRGDVDIIGGLSTDRTVELQKQGFKLQTLGLSTVANFSFSGTWLSTGPTSKKEFRQAMSYAINRQELANTFYKGLAVPGGRWFMDEQGYGWDPTWKPDPYDPAKVKELLAAAGYPSKFSNPVVNIFAQAGPQADLMQALQGYWDVAGIKTKIQIVDSMTYGGYFFVRNEKPDYPNVGGIIPWVFPTVFNSIYHSANMYRSTGVHSTGSDPKADELYTKATTELDPVKAKQYYTDFQNYGKEMWVNVGLVKLPSYWVVGPSLGEFSDQAFLSLNDALAGIKKPK